MKIDVVHIVVGRPVLELDLEGALALRSMLMKLRKDVRHWLTPIECVAFDALDSRLDSLEDELYQEPTE